MNGYQIVSESLASKIFYHSSPTQGLKIIDPRNETRRIGNRGTRVFVSDSKAFSSGFTFRWNSSDGIRFGQTDDGPWTMEIPKKFKSRMMKPCSIYTVENQPYIPIRDMSETPVEFYTRKSVRIIKEEKYRTSLEAMKSNGVKVAII